MSDEFLAVPAGLDSFSSASEAASAAITTVGSADSLAMLMAAASALGPIGATYLGAYGPAQANNLAATLLVGGVHGGVGVATDVSKSAIVSSDTA